MSASTSNRAASDRAASDRGRPAERDACRRTPVSRGPIAALIVVLAGAALSGFTAGPAASAAARPASIAASHPDALCYGRLQMHERIASLGSDRWEICFRRGLAVARIEVRGDGASDLDCVVRGPDGRIAAQDTSEGDVCRLSWRVRASGIHRLSVQNVGAAPTAYALVTR